jgi:hypothetical protein
MGRAYITAVPESERNEIMERVRELVPDDRWLEIKAGIDRAMRDISELGVCCSFGEWQKDVNGIAVPVRPGGGLPPMPINCGAPAYMVSKDFLLEKVRPRLIALANELETSLSRRLLLRFQFHISTLRSGTCEKCFILFVTSVSCCDTACAAINKSIFPIGLPIRSIAERTRAW